MRSPLLRQGLLLATLISFSAVADPVGSGWSVGLSCPPKGADGVGTMSASSSGGFGAAGTCRRVKGLFSKLVFDTFGGGTLRATTAFSLQTPSVLITPPLLTTESQPIFSVANACPVSPTTLDLNWLFVQWTDTERRALTNTYLFGTATYSRTSGLAVTAQYDIDGSVYWAGPRPMPGSCTNGVYTSTHGGAEQDLDGKAYFNASGMGAYKTTAGRATFFFPRFPITAATHFGSKTFRGIAFDSDAGNGVGDVRQIRGSADAAGTTFTIQALSDPESDIVDSGGSAYTDTLTFTGGNINNPAPGMLFGSVTRTGNGAGIGGVACIANGQDGDILLLCSGESPSDNSLPFHFSLYAENRHNKADGPNHYVDIVVHDDVSGKVYVTGQFTTYNGSARSRIARLNADGSLDTTFDPGTGFNGDGEDFELVVASTGKVYVSGDFTSYNGTGRNRIVRLNTDGSLDTGFNPGSGFNGTTDDLALDTATGKLYVAGAFSSFNGTPRNGLARLNTDGSLDTTFAPGGGFNDGVDDLAVDASTAKLVAVGEFTSFAGTGRNRVARLNDNGSLDTTFDPGSGFNGDAQSVAVDGSGRVYVGGSFTSFNGTGRRRVARLTAGGSIDTAFDPGTGADDDDVFDIALDTSSGKLYVSGQFSSFNGIAREGLVLLSTIGSVDTTFDAGTAANINSLSVQTSTGELYAAGNFESFAGVPLNKIARLHTDGTIDTAFGTSGSGVSELVLAIAIDATSGKAIIGGDFSYVVGAARPGIARLNTDGSVDAGFDPGSGVSGAVLAVAVDPASGKSFVGGYFTDYDGTPRNNIARVNADGSVDTTYDPGGGFDSNVLAVALDTSTGKLYAGGFFTDFDGTGRNRIARLNANGSLDTGFDPGTGFDGSVRALAFDAASGKLYVAGDFGSYNGTSRNSIARLNPDGSLDTDFNPGSGFNTPALAVAIDAASGNVYVGGYFSDFDGTGRNGIARLTASGSLDTAFDPGTGVNADVTTVAVDGATGKVYAAGQFTLFGGTPRGRIARVNTNGSLDTGFNPGSGFNEEVFALAVDAHTGKILAGTSATAYGTSTIAHFARLTYTGALD